MEATTGSRRGPGLKVGDLVEVRSKAEILATLDDNGELDSLPFMPEMLAFCGQTLRVRSLAIKLCDTAGRTGMHRLRAAVHLEDTRCDGAAHGGCQAGCLLYWKEAWLRRLDPVDPTSQQLTPAAAGEAPARLTEPQLVATTRRGSGPVGSAQERFACQATELPRAAPDRLPWWHADQYVRDVRAGNARPAPMARSVLILLFNKFQRANERLLPRFALIHGAEPYPFVRGRLSETPRGSLGLRQGEWVRVKSRPEILATLDRRARNRGLSFDAEMLKYCGRQARVLRRVEQIIDEGTGQMLRLRSDCVILEGFVCAGDYNQYCPRRTYIYWREVWLERVGHPSPVDLRPHGSEGDRSA